MKSDNRKDIDQLWPWEEKVESSVYKSKKKWPKISLITPSYNQGRFIEKTIQSVLSQNYPNLEYIVIDGGSTDNTIDILKKYDTNIDVWVSEPDNGQSNAINKGFNQASGEIYGWLNSDDFLLENALYRVGKTFMEYPEIVACVGHCQKVSPEGELLDIIKPMNLNVDSIADWSFKGFFYQPACFFRSNIFHKVGGLNEVLNFAMDVDLWLKLLEQGPFKKIDKPLAAAHIHEEMKTFSDIEGRDLETASVAIWHNKMPQARQRLRSYLDYSLKEGFEFEQLMSALKYRIKKKVKAFIRNQLKIT